MTPGLSPLDRIVLLAAGTLLVAAGGAIVLLAQQLRRSREEARAREERARRAEADALQARAALVHAQRVATLGQLATGLAHEVRNPLSGVIGWAQLARPHVPPDAPFAAHLAHIEEEGRRARDLLEETMRLAHREEAPPRPLALETVVERAARAATAQLRLSGCELTVRHGAALPSVLGNEPQLVQILLNLLLNAAGAQPGGGTLELDTARAPDGRVRVTVADRGAGVPVELRDRIFEPFVTTRAGGTGLGLYVSRELARRHGGELALEPREGGGTRAVLHLPPAPDSAAPEAEPTTPDADPDPGRAAS